MMQAVWTFPHNYKCDWLEELPQPQCLRHLYFPGATNIGGVDGDLLRVEPRSAAAWIGTFARGTLSPKGVTGAFSMPDPSRLFVVARGRGYVIPVDEPNRYEDLEFYPILDVRPVPRLGVLVLANFTELLAYGEAGIRWRTARLTWDRLKITEVGDDEICGEYWDMRGECMASFTVDLQTGQHKGGAELT